MGNSPVLQHLVTATSDTSALGAMPFVLVRLVTQPRPDGQYWQTATRADGETLMSKLRDGIHFL
ncbi:hypothetical protein QQ25_03600 [Mycolicibacterium setense]|nr:hypothetical protein QQ25_03600 [Mycolicibacterium setense]